MARPLRVEFPGELYHVTARGNGRLAIFVDDSDRERFLVVLASVVGNAAVPPSARASIRNAATLVEIPRAQRFALRLSLATVFVGVTSRESVLRQRGP
jgi:hypothetical protein